ncbi:16S rRNA (uracil1498-N3)-methyltransferase [Sphaerotilus hippei]|uniref:Ribosomal RNA small subunit methyltransferase E n=1 Tax=Sphaerotilus hippei TaxID=744406 RepID=A0A318GWG8_9BURK|nr:16S rRNA (uracil(1498)-N(3))-methyltransferase [Sphaerotilus hippei]PXW93830.1 16S rRNA (uracil1498-N3)-methyltransferase [Sphaerotilus hippei]
MAARFHLDPTQTLCTGLSFKLPAGAARHAQVLRLQPGDPLLLFNGTGGEWQAEILRMGRQDVEVEVGRHVEREVELPLQVTLVAGMPANDRFDWLIEKACELGVAVIQPTLCERSVLRLSGERADKKRDHWQGAAAAAAEQCGATRVPVVRPVRTLEQVLRQQDGPAQPGDAHWILSLAEARSLPQRWNEWQAPRQTLTLYSGPEGGWSPDEENRLRTAGALPTRLGPRVLRSETAPIAALAWIATQLHP